MDIIAHRNMEAWVQRNCVADRRADTALITLFEDWSTFAHASGVAPKHLRDLHQFLRMRGHSSYKKYQVWRFYGLRLRKCAFGVPAELGPSDPVRPDPTRTFPRWLQERTIRDPESRGTLVGVLHEDYAQFVDMPMTDRRLSRLLQENGFRKRRYTEGWHIEGLELKQ